MIEIFKVLCEIALIILVIILFLKIMDDLHKLYMHIRVFFIYRKHCKRTKKYVRDINVIETNASNIIDKVSNKNFYIINDCMYNDIYNIRISPVDICMNGTYYKLKSFDEYIAFYSYLTTDITPNAYDLTVFDAKYQLESFKIINPICEEFGIKCTIANKNSITISDNIINCDFNYDLFVAIVKYPAILIGIKYVIDNNIKHLMKSNKSDIVDYIREEANIISNKYPTITNIPIFLIENDIEHIFNKIIISIDKKESLI